MGLDPGKDDDCDNIGHGCALEHFSESEEVIKMIDNVQKIYNTPEIEVQYEKLYCILKQYYEQPHLLDPHLDVILAKFICLIQNKELPMELKHAVFNYMYQIMRVRGYKVVVRHLPHEVSDLILVLHMLEEQDPNNKDTWRSRFVLLLWLSIVVIIPFHMSRLDGFTASSQDSDSPKKLTVMERIFNICKTYALSRDTCAEASAYLASKFLTRSDVKEVYMSAFFEWACDLNSNLKDEGAIHYGVLAAVAAVLKHGKREDILPLAPKLLKWVTNQNYKQQKAMLVRKYGVKIVQRLGLTFLRARAAPWRYTVGARRLSSTLATGCAGDVQVITPPSLEESEDIPQEVEEVVELLLCGLRDDDTVVRWSCAKGLGRIGARLPAAAASEVAQSVLELFVDSEKETAWHGGCMAMAELARRGLLAPWQLVRACSCLVRALRRDEARALGGAGGGGRAARDAACHAAWAFARAYDQQALQPLALSLAHALAATACFDREINCRRAASAAYQENVGRHGLFPHGIDVLSTADFQSVGPRNNAYLVVAPKIAEFQEYTKALIDHLVELKVEHWDCAIRELAAKALFKIADKDPSYVATEVLPILLEKTNSIDLNVRHGAVLAIGECIHSLSQTYLDDGTKASSLISEECISNVRDLVVVVREKQQFRGLGGELMRQAFCQAIASLSLAAAPYHSHCVIDDWLNLIEECLAHEVQAIREKAIHALPLLFKEYLLDDSYSYSGVNSKVKRSQKMEKYCQQLYNAGVNGMVYRMGYARAVGTLPKEVLVEHLSKAVSSLIACTKVTDSTQKWAESRRDAVIGLTELCRIVGVVDLAEYLDDITSALLDCLSEYTVDMRGDIGAWVREASMTGLLSICRACAVEAPHLNTASLMNRIMCGVAQQAVEKIDRTRAHAGRVFTDLIHNDPPIQNIPEHEALKRIFPPEELELKRNDEPTDTNTSESCNIVLWLFPGHTMPRFVQMLAYPVYRYSLIKGFIVSGGELTESLVKHTTQSLFSYFHSLHDDQETLVSICDTINQVFADHLHVKRITGPIFNFLDRLLSSGSISPILEDPNSQFAMDLFKNLQLELSGAKNIYKLLDSINVFCQLIQVKGDVCSKSLCRLSMCLCHCERYVRRCAATRLYEALTLYADVFEKQQPLEQVMTILADTDWEQDVAVLRDIRNQICDLLQIKRPVLKQKTT